MTSYTQTAPHHSISRRYLFQPQPPLSFAMSLLGPPAICAPRFRRLVFDSLHFLSHPGIRATQRLKTLKYVWPSIIVDVRQWARSCLHCIGSGRHSPQSQWTDAHPLEFFSAACSTDIAYVRSIVTRLTSTMQQLRTIQPQQTTAGTNEPKSANNNTCLCPARRITQGLAAPI